MLRVSRLVAGVSPYNIFMKHIQPHPSLVGLQGAVRCKQMSELWMKMPKTERRRLILEASSTPPVKRKIQTLHTLAMSARKKRKQSSAYHRFVSKNFRLMPGPTAQKKLKEVMFLWKYAKLKKNLKTRQEIRAMKVDAKKTNDPEKLAAAEEALKRMRK